MRIVRSSIASEDLIEIASFYGAEDAAVALRFYDAYEMSIQTIANNPRIGVAKHTKVGESFRLSLVKGFDKVLILYKEYPNEIVILRILHSARDYTRFI